MRKTITLLSLTLGCGLQAQSISSLSINPGTPTECQRFSLTINGNLPQAAQFSTFTYKPSDPGEIVIHFGATGNAGGAQPAFSETVQGLGPYAIGTWQLTVNLYMNGGLADSETITFTVVEQGPVDLGEPGERTICNSDPPFPLFDVIGGDPTPGGHWLNAQGVQVPNGIFVPGTHAGGAYTYVLDLAGPCTTGYQSVTIDYIPNASAGYGGTVQACATAVGPPVDLFAQLNGSPETGGTWSGPTALNNGTYVPGVNTPGQYVYTVTGSAPCGNPTATVTIQPIQPSNAGTGSNLVVCENNATVNLNAHVTGEQTSGSWISEIGFTVAGYNEPVDLAFMGGGAYYYVVPNAICGADTATVNVTVMPLPCSVGLDEHANRTLGLLVMPNPAQDQVMIESRAARGRITFELHASDGRLVRREAVNGPGGVLRSTFDLNGVAPGPYLFRMITTEGQAVQRLIVR